LKGFENDLMIIQTWLTFIGPPFIVLNVTT